jgi:hypothetical protein
MPAGRRWRLGRDDVEICDWSRCESCDAAGPRGFPVGLLRDEPVIRRLRDVLLDFTWPVDRLTDRQVVDLTSHLLASGRLHVCRKVEEKRETGGGPTQAAEPAEPVYVPRRQTVSSPAPRVEDAPTLSDSLDGAAQSRVLLEAAEFGLPFCEECQRAFAAARGRAN